jgi:surface protein
MSGLFETNSQFNVDISNWDVSNVTKMTSMFKGAASFNQDISCWDVNNVVDMSGMFDGAATFNQDLSGWNVNKVAVCDDFASNTEAWTLKKPKFDTCNP